MAQSKVLIAEDDLQLGFLMKEYLEDEGYEVIMAENGDEAWECFQKRMPDICLLDVNMPARDGFAVAKRIRQVNDVVPILFITAKSQEEDKIQGFEMGADDYILKPFSMKEVLLRMQVFLRRTKMMISDEQEIYELGETKFMVKDMRLVKGAQVSQLTQKETALLAFFCAHRGKTLKREEILLHVWGKNDYFLGRSLDVFVTKLRKHLKQEPSVTIETIHNVGFRMS